MTPISGLRTAPDRDQPDTFPALGTPGTSIVGVRLHRTVDELVVPAAAHHVVLVNIGRPFRLEEKLDGRAYQTSGTWGDVAVIPAGTPAEFRSRTRHPQEVEALAMLLDSGFVRKVAAGAGGDPDGIELVGTVAARDPAVERVGMALMAEMEQGGLLGELYTGSLATALAIHLLRNHSSLGARAAPDAERRVAGGLSRSDLRRVLDYIEETLDQNPTLAELAAVAHMSPFHFSRLFKRSTGCSPHRYVLERRVERATALLRHTELPLHEVALRAGFADQSHLAKHTRRILGVTPASLRRSRA